MSNLAFDTHKFVTDLNKAGMETAVAEVLANTYASLMNDRIATKDDLLNLGTGLKGDLANVRMELKGDLANVRMELEGDIAALEERLNTRIIAAQLTGILATCAILGSLMVFLQA